MGAGKGGWGAVARDSDGDLVFAAAGAVPHAIDPLHAEAFGLLQGAKMASNLGIGRARFATDKTKKEPHFTHHRHLKPVSHKLREFIIKSFAE